MRDGSGVVIRLELSRSELLVAGPGACTRGDISRCVEFGKC